MNKELLFSIIVPAHNSSKFISKLLDSIPKRDDTEIIIIDDHSDDYEQLEKVIKRCKLSKQIKLLKNSGKRSAGTTRNVGIKHATGRWIIFADSDDSFAPNLGAAMDRYANSEHDLVIFEPKAIVAGTDIVSNRVDYIHYTFELNAKNRIDDKTLSYRLTPVWSKFYRRGRVKHIKFESSLSADDILFSAQAAFATRGRIAIDKKDNIYIVTERKNSITKSKFKSVKKLADWYIIRRRADRWLVQNIKSVKEPIPKLARGRSVCRKLFLRKKRK